MSDDKTTESEATTLPKASAPPTSGATGETEAGEVTTSPARSDEMVRCALTGKEIPASEAYWAPPLITAWELVSTIVSNLIHSPGNLSTILFEKQDDVPYAPEAREELAARRTLEQLKLLGILLIILAAIVVPTILLWPKP